MRITQVVVPLLAATHFATGRPLAECLRVADEGFGKLRELRPNILQITTNPPQAQQLHESGEVDLYLSPDSRTTLFRAKARWRCRRAWRSCGVARTRSSARPS